MSLTFDPMNPQGWDETLLEQGRYKEWFYAGMTAKAVQALKGPERTTTKWCSTCKQRKPNGAFNLDTSGAHLYRCNKCFLATQGNGRWESDTPPTWMERANCRSGDPELFFPENEYTANLPDAPWRAYCTDCPVLAQCLEFGKRSDSVGVFGGQFTRYKNQTSGPTKQASRGRPRKVPNAT